MRKAIIALLLLAGPAVAQAAAGQVLFALGRVEIERGGETLAARRGTPVEVGDTVRTGPSGLAQVRFGDGSLMSLRAASAMTVEDFRLPAATAARATPVAAPAAPRVAAAAATPQGAGRSVLRLLRGAFRTVTGLIGKGANDDYQVLTPAATIGIRGTDYSAAYCSGDCGGAADGLYVGVSNGEIFVTNDSGALVLYDNQYGYVRDGSTPPGRELAPPAPLETPIEGEGEAPDEDGTEPVPAGERGEAGPRTAGGTGTGGSTTQAGSTQPEGTYELRPGEPGRYAFAVGPFQSRADFAGAGGNGVYTDDTRQLIGFLAPDTQRLAFYSIGTSSNVNTGFDPATGLRWGRWSGGNASVGGAALDLSNRSLHWIYAFASSAPVLPTSGTASYRLVGNTDPTDNFGNVGFLGSATFVADFTNQVVSSTLDLGINNTVWQASGSGSLVGGGLFGGGYSVTVNDAGGSPLGTGAGSFAGFFTSGAAAAGLNYSLNSGSTTVSGAAAFEKGPGAP